MSTISFELGVILALILLNGLFAMAEAAMLSGRKSRLEALAREGSVSARTALVLAKDPHRLLSIVQIGITLIGIVAGVYGGATIGQHLMQFCIQLGMSQKLSEYLSVSLVVIAITYLSIVIGELVPKRIAIAYSEKVSMLIAPLFLSLTKLFAPFVWILDVSSSIVLKLLRIKGQQEGITEEELRIMIEEGAAAGAVEGQESDILIRVLKLGDQKIASLMTPRPQVEFFHIDDSLEIILQKVNSTTHSWYPVIEGSIDVIKGVVHVKDIWNCMAQKKECHLEPLLKPALYIPSTANILQLLIQFKALKTNFALVVDEHGGLDGVITLIDVTETILGELPVPFDSEEEPSIAKRHDGSWLVSGTTSIDEFKEYFGLDLDAKKEKEFHTVAGFILSVFGNLPKLGEHIVFEGYHFEVVDMDGNRIDKIIVSLDSSIE